MSAIHPQVPAAVSATLSATAASEKYLIAFVIQGDDVFKITADNIIHTTNTASGPAFDAIAKLKAAAALLELTNRHKERPDELRQMARELAGEGMKLMARASSAIQPVMPPEVAESVAEAATEPAVAARPVPVEEAVVPPVLQPVAPPAPLRMERPVVPAGPAPVPRPEQRAADDSELPGNSPTNSKIALISG